jgi:GTPase involved in cell partitioning and DNA repair
MHKGMDGKEAKDIIIYVPLGTLVYEMIREKDYIHQKREIRSDKNYEKVLIADLDVHGKKELICKGGRGGIGNTTKKNITKDSKLIKGLIGEEKELVSFFSFLIFWN